MQIGFGKCAFNYTYISFQCIVFGTIIIIDDAIQRGIIQMIKNEITCL